MATSTAHVDVLAPSGSVVSSAHVDVAAPSGSATSTCHVAVTNPPQYAQAWDGTALVPIRVGVYNGSTIDWLSPPL